MSRIAETGWTMWRIPMVTHPAKAAAFVRRQPGVLYAEPVNVIYPLYAPPIDADYAVEETDPAMVLILGEDVTVSFRRLWHLTDTNAEAAWGVWPNKWYTAADKPTSPPTISIIDTGVDMNHPDFINAGGTSTNSLNGGQIDFARSAQFRLGSRVPGGGNPQDIHGHGTHVAGLAVASGNNADYVGHGVIGTGYNARAFVCRVFDDTGSGTDADAAAAIFWSVDRGADIINLSLGTENYSQLFQDAVTYAWQKGSLVVAAGNEDGGGGGDLGPIYPAACSGALAVSANGPDGSPAVGTYSGFGPYVDIAAPGGDLIQSTEYFLLQWVFSTAVRGPSALSQHPTLYPPYTENYSYLIGTSMAAPLVSGAAGLYYGQKNIRKGTGWANVRAYKKMQRSAANVMSAPYGGWEPYQGYGSLDMWSFLMETDARGAQVGGVEGIVYSNGTPLQNVSVKAKRTSGGGLTYSTTTRADGNYRFEGMPAGTYEVWTAPFGAEKRKKVVIETGCDTTGFDFWCGGYTGDSTGPTVAKFKITKITGRELQLDQWGYDAETGIDKVRVKIGTTAGGADVLPFTEVVPTSNILKVGGFSTTAGTTYHATIEYTNGNGATATAAASAPAAALFYDSVCTGQVNPPYPMAAGTTANVSVTMKNVGSYTWTRSNVHLYSLNPRGNTYWGFNRLDLPVGVSVAPGASYTFNFVATAPLTPGYYGFQWQITKNDGVPVGLPSANGLTRVY